MTAAQQPGEIAEQTHDYYGVPLWLMKDYLVQLGAQEAGENFLQADGWSASLSKAAERRLGSLVVGGTTVKFSGDVQVLESMFERLHWKTLRGGG